MKCWYRTILHRWNFPTMAVESLQLRRYDIETLSALLVIGAKNSPHPPPHPPVQGDAEIRWVFVVVTYMLLKKQLNYGWAGTWCRSCDVIVMLPVLDVNSLQLVSGKLLPCWQSIIETSQMTSNGQKRYFSGQMTIFIKGMFLAATKQLYEWYFLSVRLSVRLSVHHTFLTMFPSLYHHHIFRSYHHGPG